MTLALAERKTEALAILNSHGVPHRRIEEWKYSDLKSALGEAGIGNVVAQWTVQNLPAGVEMFDLSLPNPPSWVAVHFALVSQNVMSAASLALSAGGVAFRVPASTVIADPLKLDFLGPGHVRALLVLEAGASLSLQEGVGPADFRNVGFEIVIGETATLEHVRLSPDAGDAVLVEEADVRIAANGSYRAHFASFGSKLSRMELEVALEGAGAKADLSGVSVLDGKRHSDITTHVIHRLGDTASSQLFKHIVGGARALSIREKLRLQRVPMAATPSRRPRRSCWARMRKPTLSLNWRSTPMMSNVPMARQWATWMRIRCFICVRAAFRKLKPEAFCCMHSWRMWWQRLPISTSANGYALNF